MSTLHQRERRYTEYPCYRISVLLVWQEPLWRHTEYPCYGCGRNRCGAIVAWRPYSHTVTIERKVMCVMLRGHRADSFFKRVRR